MNMRPGLSFGFGLIGALALLGESTTMAQYQPAGGSNPAPPASASQPMPPPPASAAPPIPPPPTPPPVPAPAPAYQYPPPAPAYPPAPAPSAYPPPTMASGFSEPGFRRGFFAMPYLGLHIPVGSSGDSMDPGFRIGALLGGHINPMVSLNGEMTIDVMNPKDVPSGMDVTEVMVDVLFSPLIHFGNGQIEGFFGPKIGAFGMSGTASMNGMSADTSARGLAYGFNLGAAIPVGNIAVGGLVSFVGRHATHMCVTEPGQSEQCSDSPSGDDFKAFSITVAMLF